MASIGISFADFVLQADLYSKQLMAYIKFVKKLKLKFIGISMLDLFSKFIVQACFLPDF